MVPGFDRKVALSVAIAAGAIAALSAGEPTRLAGWDELLKFGFAAVVVLSAYRAPAWAVVVFAMIAVAAAGLSPWAMAAWIALGLALAAFPLVGISRVLQTGAAALAVQTLLRLPDLAVFGVPSLVATVAAAVLVVTGMAAANRRERDMISGVGMLLALALAVALVVGGAALLTARSDISRGVAAASRGLTAARAGDTSQVLDQLSTAESALRQASDRAGGPLTMGLRMVPVAAQNLEAIQSAADQGARVASTAATAARDADLESLRLSGASLPVDQLATMAPTLQATVAALTNAALALAEAESGWVLGPLQDRIGDFQTELAQVIPEAKVAAQAAAVVPGLLGSDGPRRYFIMFGTPAESREFGGFVGSWAMVHAQAGNLSLGESGRILRLYDLTRANTLDPTSVPGWFSEMAEPTTYPQNLTSSPNFEVVATAARQVLAGVGDPDVDGFVYLDAWALRDMLQLTGPVDDPFGEAQLGFDNADEFFFDQQYRVDRAEIFDELAIVAGQVIDQLSVTDLPGPEELGRILGPAARAGRIQMITFDPAENEFLRSVKLLRDFGPSGTQDFVGFVQTNSTASKLDLYLHRDVEYRVRVTGQGALSAVAAMTLRSQIPTDAPPFVFGPNTQGVNRPLLSLYTPHDAVSVTIDGEPAQVSVTTEFGLNRYLIEFPVPADGTPVEVEYTVLGQVDPTRAYDLTVWHQPLVNDDDVTVEYVGPEGSFAQTHVLTENLVLTTDGSGGADGSGS